MNTLPDHVKQIVHEYENTYRNKFDNVMVEMNSNRIGIATYALEPLGDDLCARRECYSFKNIKQRRYNYHTPPSYSYDTTPSQYPF